MVRLSLAALCAGLTAGLAAELTFMPVLQASTAQWHTLTIEAVPLGNYGFDTYGFNGGVPGPTFRMQPGGTLQVNFVNNLNASGNNGDCATSVFCKGTTSNLHTHGLHVSSQSTADGLEYNSDDIFIEVEPGNETMYQFNLPENHMGGTHWYHPHLHHATALQAGGGAAGVIIVEDPEGYLPEPYASMEERLLFLSHHDLQKLQAIATEAQSGILETAYTDATEANMETDIFLVNGQSMPQMSISSGQWYRFRMVYAAVALQLVLDTEGDGECVHMLIAKDGVYLNTIPREVNDVILVPGSRADVAVSCTCASYPCTARLVSESPGRRLQGAAGEPSIETPNVELMTLSISEGAGTAPTLPSFAPTRPCYLVDLQGVTPDKTGSLDLAGGPPRKVTWDGIGESMTYANMHRNGGTMATWPPIADFAVGTVVEMVVGGVRAHPLHTHVNPYQITQMPNASYNKGYFQVGDWHDTLMIQEGLPPEITVRANQDRFTGKEVIHCHLLQHEDDGMMSYVSVTGTEGTTWPGAESVDGTCYRGLFADRPVATTSTTTATTTTPAPGQVVSGANRGRALGALAAVALLARGCAAI